MKTKKQKIKKIPYHLGVIIDGNRRWALKRGLPSFEGHRRGLEKVKALIQWCFNKKIKVLTVFVFSTENWERSKKEVGYLMRLFKDTISNEFKKIEDGKIRIKIIGQKEKFSAQLAKEVKKIEEQTKNNEQMTLNIALSYGGRTEIIEAVKNIIRKKIPPEKITENTMKENLWTSDVDLIIRTGKEQRISNF